MSGPLTGLRVLEIGSIGPGPFGAMILADLGADVLRIDRASGAQLIGPGTDFREELLHRGRRSVAVDLKHPDGAAAVLQLVERADVLLEGFRPGVMERLGLGPDVCLARNPGLVYGRMTGYGQTGPLAQTPGHDINYLALSGVLAMVGRRDQPPTPPLSLVGDFGGGGMLLAVGVLAALHERSRSGAGQVIDAAMIDGSALLATPFFGYRQTGGWSAERGTNTVDSGAPFYDAYQTADGRWLAVGAIEPQFYADLVDLLGLPADLPDQNDRSRWPELKEMIAHAVRQRNRDDWIAAAEGRSPCVAPVLEPEEVPSHPHHASRQTFVEVNGLRQPAPAPRFSRTPASLGLRPPLPGEHTRGALADWGVPAETVDGWIDAGALRATADPPAGGD
ncbi:carnitine dehydratase [Gordonia paraffinivorans]|uniref:CaiB/BaiF CoA transferase family protein n=2 Tax=Gordonia paraffinivorans TaxID=175628 RepID=UPI001C92C02E|nr:CaiB/BaiF CoA-transferase family protein [Gordonia paraffinivorans]MBY4575626.1 carnitine dehydratase [Gordonia paraffinivorans]